MRTFTYRSTFLYAQSLQNESFHKVPIHIHLEYHSVCPVVRIGTPPLTLRQASVSLPPEPKGVEYTRLLVRDGSQFGRLERKSLALCLLCESFHKYPHLRLDCIVESKDDFLYLRPFL